MNKDEMIKDMAMSIELACTNNELDLKDRQEIAKTLYTLSYRKVGDDEIVLKKSEYENLRLAQYNAQTTINENFLLALEKIEQAKQETATEILQKLKNKQTFLLADEVFGRKTPITQKINELADKYGIELED
jgi:hypothetical protein